MSNAFWDLIINLFDSKLYFQQKLQQHFEKTFDENFKHFREHLLKLSDEDHCSDENERKKASARLTLYEEIRNKSRQDFGKYIGDHLNRIFKDFLCQPETIQKLSLLSKMMVKQEIDEAIDIEPVKREFSNELSALHETIRQSKSIKEQALEELKKDLNQQVDVLKRVRKELIMEFRNLCFQLDMEMPSSSFATKPDHNDNRQPTEPPPQQQQQQ